MSNPWEKEKKSHQSTIEKLVARKADIYAHLGAAIAYQQRTIQQSCSPIRYKLPR